MFIHLLYAQDPVDASTMTNDRVVATAAAMIALAGVISGVLALTRHHRTWHTTVALVAGIAGMLVGGFVVATADGGPGTGNGIVGGYAAVAVGLIAIGLTGLARARSHRTVPQRQTSTVRDRPADIP